MQTVGPITASGIQTLGDTGAGNARISYRTLKGVRMSLPAGGTAPCSCRVFIGTTTGGENIAQLNLSAVNTDDQKEWQPSGLIVPGNQLYVDLTTGAGQQIYLDVE